VILHQYGKDNNKKNKHIIIIKLSRVLFFYRHVWSNNGNNVSYICTVCKFKNHSNSKLPNHKTSQDNRRDDTLLATLCPDLIRSVLPHYNYTCIYSSATPTRVAISLQDWLASKLETFPFLNQKSKSPKAKTTWTNLK